MDAETFDDIVRGQIKLSEEVLLSKAKEYADDSDRLHNFFVAARLQGITPEQALGGMMVKHSVSIYDMIRDGETHPLEQWEEKIGDHINYLLLLKAVVIETGRASTSADEDDEFGDDLVKWFNSLSPITRQRQEHDERIARAVGLALGEFKPSDLLGEMEDESDAC